MSNFKSPVYNVKAVPIEKVKANDYNPNAVAPPEMELLETSIWEDGYTQPVVTYYDNFTGYKDRDGLESLLTKITNHFKVEISTVRAWSEGILATKDP